jgi:hypothetical protein
METALNDFIQHGEDKACPHSSIVHDDTSSIVVIMRGRALSEDEKVLWERFRLNRCALIKSAGLAGLDSVVDPYVWSELVRYKWAIDSEIPFPGQEGLTYALETRRFGPDLVSCRRNLKTSPWISDWPSEYPLAKPRMSNISQSPGDGRGKGSLYHFFVKKKHKEAKERGDQTAPAVLTKRFAKEWKELSPEDRAALWEEQNAEGD